MWAGWPGWGHQSVCAQRIAEARVWLLAAAVAAVGLFLAGPGAGGASARAQSRLLNQVQVENARRGNGGWQIPAGAGTIISGYASQLSLFPGQVAQLHISAPAGDRYRVLLYRLGWYHGLGGRLISCLPSCHASRAAVAQPPITPPDPLSGLYRAPWRVTARLRIPADAVSGYFEAKLEVVRGPDTGAVGSVPLIVRQSPFARPAAILVQVPVNTWEAYNPWGGKSLYGSGQTHATEVSFDRPFDQTEFHNMQTDLELPWVHFLERHGYDVAYQTDLDTSRDPGSLLHHRLVFANGHDEYWTQRERDAFNRALARSTNLMFGSNSGLWRMRYASNHRTEVEWRNRAADPDHSPGRATGYFRSYGEPECQLMGVQYEYYGQRELTAPPTAYTVVGPAGDPWLAPAGLTPGDIVPGVVGYEWDSLEPGCFHGQVVPLMHADPWGPGGPVSADMVRATAPSGARVFAMGTMELPFGFEPPNPDQRLLKFVKTALTDLTRPAPPAELRFRRSGRRLIVTARLAARDPRVLRVAVRYPHGGQGCPNALGRGCRLTTKRNRGRYSAVAIDLWGGRSLPLVVNRA